MRYAEFLSNYIVWHYSRGIVDFLNVWGNYVWFFYNYFSIGLLTKTLLSPWRRMSEHSKTGFHLEALFEKIVANVVVRVVGIFLRLFIIISGVAVIILTFIIGFLFFLVWLMLPFSIASLFISAFVLILA